MPEITLPFSSTPPRLSALLLRAHNVMSNVQLSATLRSRPSSKYQL